MDWYSYWHSRNTKLSDHNWQNGTSDKFKQLQARIHKTHSIIPFDKLKWDCQHAACKDAKMIVES